MHLIRFDQVGLEFGEQIILKEADLTLNAKERVCLIGRNGAGKSTLLKLITGEIQSDSGEITSRRGLQVSQLEQSLPKQLNISVEEYVLSGLAEQKQRIAEFEKLSEQTLDDAGMLALQDLQHQIEAHGDWNIESQAQTTISDLQLPCKLQLGQLSGGWQRRVSLAKALVSKPDLLLLDEPTNHLDINTIQWLEQRILHYPGTVLFITHDRAFLQSLATRIVEIDRGKLINWPGNYRKFLTAKQQATADEKRHNQLFDKKLAEEEAWIRQGIKARRTRNEGRVRALESMREERSNRIAIPNSVQLSISEAEPPGKTVIAVKNLGFRFQEQRIVENLTIKIRRGDRIGLVGNNGVGKSTLLKLLLGEIEPQQGTVKHGTNLEIAYFSQARHSLDPDKSVAEIVGEGTEYVTINGKQRHVVGYLKGFLFSPKRALSPIKVLSGGERNRVILAKLFSKPSNLLVLDEPTNDLDVETLEALEQQLCGYKGTLLVVSHDRQFLDKVVQSLLVFEADEKLEFYHGGFSDWLTRGKKLAEKDQPEASEVQHTNSSALRQADKKPTKLTYKLQHELDSLPGEIERLEQTLSEIHDIMNNEDFYEQPFSETGPIIDKAKKLEQDIESATLRWMELEQLQEQLSTAE